MNFRRILFVVAACLLTVSTAWAQEVKIGYTNIEMVMAYMPEVSQMEKTLQVYQQQLTKQLQTKEQYAMGKLQEYEEKMAKNQLSPDAQKNAETELRKLDGEIQKFAQEAEFKLLSKREELLQPIVEKLQKAIDDVAKEKGFTYILNQTTSAGVSTILFGPDENNVTEDIMKKLGIEIPADATGGN